MSLTKFSVDHRPVVLTGVVIALLVGISTFLTMSRREDPEILIRTCIISTRWPGAKATKVEDLVTDPLEDAIQQIDEVEEIRSQSRVGYSLIEVDIDERLWDIAQLFDEVRNKVDEVRTQLPEGCGVPYVNADFGDVSAVCLSLYQTPMPGQTEITRSYTYRDLEIYAEQIQRELKTIDSVAKVDILGIQDEVITIEVDGNEWSKLGLTTDDLQGLLESRNIVAPGGQLDTERGRFSVVPTGEFTSTDQIAGVVVEFQDGRVPINLGDLPIKIERGYLDPPRKLIRFQTPERVADRSLLLSITMKSGRNIVDMGEAIDASVSKLYSSSLPPDLQLTRINNLPRQVDSLVKDFITNLWQAIVIVLVVALIMMGLRPAIIMAAAIPLCMISTLALVPFFGVELEQFSIASLIIALGMVVDNAIVVSDNTYQMIRSGASRREAVIRGAHDLAIPILTSTLTTVGAFLPLATIVGNTGEYVRSLPIVVATTLLVSYAIAMMVTPIFCFWLLKPDAGMNISELFMTKIAKLFKRGGSGDQPAGKPLYDRAINWCMNHKFFTIGGAFAALIASLQLMPLIGSQFFPGGVRDQFFVHIWLPEGSPIGATERVTKQIEKLAREASVDEDGNEVLANSVSFVGTGGPRLMLTNSPEQDFPNYAFLLVNTTDALASRAFAQRLRESLGEITEARVDVRDYMLGPYIKNPVEYRVYGEDADVLRNVAPRAIQAFNSVAGTREVTDDWLNSAYQIEVDVQAEAANLAMVTNANVAKTLNSMVSGGQLTTYREGDHLVNILLRMKGDQRSSISDLDGLYVEGLRGKVPLDSVAELVPTWQPAVIRRRNNERVISIGSQVMPGFLANDLASQIRPQLDEIMGDLPPGYRLEEGGEFEKTSESSERIMGALQISLALILLVLIAQYNSITKPLIVLVAAPLALIGALVGLFLTGWPLGFMPSLGIVSLVGVVINNAIILIDFIESRVREGAELRAAVAESGRLRMKPILLTTLTTVGGLIPLALFGGPMWAGMSWAMIFGLSLSTGLTLLVIPTIYVLFAERFGMKVV